MDPTKPDVPVLINGTQAYAVTPPQYLGPFIAATKNKPTRIVFHNLLPTGADGDLFLPTDSSMMGSGMGPMPMAEPADLKTTDDGVREPLCTQDPKSDMCFKDNRATLHLHGGNTPWISDGTPHQWITPAGETTSYPKGVERRERARHEGRRRLTTCDKDDDGCQTFFYTNQQSARLMFYHDHAYGITRLNVYAGEAAGYLIADDTEKKLITDGVIPGAADTLPLVIQDKTFVPGDEQLKDVKDADGNITSYGQDPTWRQHPLGQQGQPVVPPRLHARPEPRRRLGHERLRPLDVRAVVLATGLRHEARTDSQPLLRRELQDRRAVDLAVPDRPVLRARSSSPAPPTSRLASEQFNDTPIVNGVAYPKVTVQPKPYRLRMLNAANDRFFNLQCVHRRPRPG